VGYRFNLSAKRSNLPALSKPAPVGRHRSGKQHKLAATKAKEHSMKYLLMVYVDEAASKAAGKAEAEQLTGAYKSYVDAMTKAGIVLGTNRLQLSAAATTVRIIDGKTQVLDGPYAETKEQLGGYLLIDVPDLDAALSWAARCPGANHGTVEVRPIWEMHAYMQQDAAE
jgi:hypothetical protein